MNIATFSFSLALYLNTQQINLISSIVTALVTAILA